MIYYFIKITDNKNPSYFFIDLTTQKNYKNRICGLRSKAIQYYHTNQGPFRNIYDIFTKDYSFYKVIHMIFKVTKRRNCTLRNCMIHI